MPNALMQTMACGLPCIAARVEVEVKISLDHGWNGLNVERSNHTR